MIATPSELPYIKTPTGEKAVELKELDINVQVTGLFSETTQTMTFYNPNQRAMEGELNFPLPDGATVCGYALDVDGQLVDGVIVPKEEARQILETEIRKGVDPGLVEQVQGNIYRTRIYPIPAQGSRTVRLSYVSDLVVQNNDASYHLSLGHAKGVGSVKLRVEVVQSPVQPEISSTGNLTLNLWDDRWVAEVKLDTAIITEDLLIRLPKLPDQIVSVEEKYDTFFFNVSRRLPRAESAPWNPGHIAILWDASGSRCPGGQDPVRILKKDFDLLETLGTHWPQLLFELQVFRNVTESEKRSFTSATDLVDYLKQIPYDGATNINDLDLENVNQDIDAVMLFSDGQDSAGKCLPPKLSKPVITVNSNANCNSAFLEYLASSSGGIYCNLIRTNTARAIDAISNLQNGVQIQQSTGCEDVFTSISNGRISILGKVTSATGKISLSGNGVLFDPIEIDRSKASRSSNISRAWAGQRCRVLTFSDEYSEDMITLGREFGLVTPGTSLLVLESLDQYLQYNITPPTSLPKMCKEFNEFKNEEREDYDHDREKHLKQVLRWWQERKKWYQTDFKSSWKKQMALKKREKIAANRMHSTREDDRVLHSMSCGRYDDFGSISSDAHLSSFAEFEVDEECDFCFEDSERGESEPTAPKLQPQSKSSITVQSWNPETPYLTVLKHTEDSELYNIYMQQRNDFAESPSFYLDCGNFFLTKNKTELGVRILSNLEELQLGDIGLLRMYAWRLQQEEQYDLAIQIFERIRKVRDDEPQSHRDLGLALMERWQHTRKQDDAIRAMSLLYIVVSRAWDRFPEIELVALMELNRLLILIVQDDIQIPETIDKRFIHPMDLDIRISMSWDADLTDIDLHVLEPGGEHAYYGHNKTLIGGLVSRDFTEGYGPEEYILHNAMPGTYIIKARYYGSHQQKICTPCTVTATVYTDYGRPNEQRQTLTLRLEDASDEQLVGEIAIEGIAWELNDGEEQKSSATEVIKLIQNIEKEMSVDEVKDVLGKPDDIRGDKKIVLIYKLDGNSHVELDFSPQLKAVRHVMNGAVLYLL